MKRKTVLKEASVLLIALFMVLSTVMMVTGNELYIRNSKSFNVESVIGLRNIMLTGYWNPTGQMIAPFSTDSYLNPDGWKGENWEGLGYNIYSFFPTPYTYNGTFEVDYQDTWEDFWNITDEIKPVAIISFGGGNGPWEIEYSARNLDSWIPDDKPPYQPTPCPPDDSVSVGFVRHSTLPVQEIADAVNFQTFINAWVDWDGYPGAYLCEYMAYLGMWYQDIHNTTSDPYRCWEAGFIHVNAGLALSDAMEATEITIREVITSIPSLPPSAPIINGQISGTAGTTYEYEFTSTDPETDDIAEYIVNWGDTNEEVITGPFASGEEVVVSHSWDEQDTYTIRARAKDTNNLWGPWGELEVTMPVNQQSTGSLFLRFLERFPNAFPILRHMLGQ